MEFEDSRNALFCDPNAYIQKINTKEQKKVVFSEPYENAPNFYLNNNFVKKDCNCIQCKKEKNIPKEEKPKHNKPNNNFLTGFNLQSLLPMLSMFKNSGGGLNLSNIMGMFGNGDNNMIASLLNNKDMLSGITSLFSGKNQEKNATQLKPTEINIKNYTRVE